MLEHLLEADPKDFISVEKTLPAALLDAQYATSLLEGLDVRPDEDVLNESQSEAARKAFLAMTTGQDRDTQQKALMKLEVPEAVKQVVGMLSAYDWAFVEQAKQMRGYAVAKILEDTQHPDVRHRLRALELLGKVTEVALFTERSEIKKVGMTDAELDEELKKRLDKYTSLLKPIEKTVEEEKE